MYELYKEECTNSGRKPVIQTFYRKMFNTQYNFSFFYPKKDQCSVCSLYEQHRIEGIVPEDFEQNYQVHQQRKEESRSDISKDKNRAEDDKRVHVSTFDLEAVLSVPCSLGGDLYNKRKLSCYNLSFYKIDNKNGQCFLQDETPGGRGSCEVGTCLYLYISSFAGDVSPVKEITFYSDTRGGQNRNKFVVAALHYPLMNIPSVEIVNHKFFESGHSQMESDSIKAGMNEERVSWQKVKWIQILKSEP